uniref:Ionotropic receptor 1 n=1 Tax=Ceracris kiangsu TaxID=227354 RepID=A0A6M6DQD6_CERKI|nr:ionotropic receptor 1 [Ceracris kiangsu]
MDNRMIRLLSAVMLIRSTDSALQMKYDEAPFDAILREMTVDILTGYFHNFTCVASISDAADPLLDVVAPLATTARVTASGPGDAMLVSALDADCLGVVVRRLDAAAAVAALLKASRRATRRASRRLLVLPTDRLHPVHVESLFALTDIKLAPDTLVARLSDDGVSFELVTLRFTGRRSWRDEVLVARWVRGRGVVPPTADLFPDKLSDLRGRELAFATFHYPPYAVLEDSTGTQDGMETRILLEFAKKVNASWRLTVDAEHEWGEIWDNNGSGNGILGAVVTDAADAGYGALYQWLHEYLFLDFSRPYIRTGITCLAPRPRPLPGWQVPLLPFSQRLWAAVGASVLVATAALFAARRSSDHLLLGEDAVRAAAGSRYATVADCFFRSVGLLVLQTPDVERRHTRVVGPTRHVLSWLLVAYLLVTASYGSGLSSVLTVPKYEPPIDSVRDLYESGIEWAATHEAWVFSLREATQPVITDLYRRFRVHKEDELHARTVARDLAYSIERLPAGYFAIGNYIDEEAASRWLRPMREDIYWERSNVVVRKGWPHLRHLDALIDRLLDSGLLLAWEGQVSRQWMAPRVQLAVQTGISSSSSHAGDGPTKLRLGHVQGEFALLALGLLLSVVAFLAELLVHRVASRNVVTVYPPRERIGPGPKSRGSNGPGDKVWA